MTDRPAAIVFDMDGTLFDSEALQRDAFLAAARETGCGLGLVDFLALVGLPASADRATLAARLGPSGDVLAFERSWQRDAEAASPRLALKAGVVAMLGRLDELRLPRAICTSSDHAAVGRNLALHGLTGRFDAVVAAGDYRRPKPAPDPFRRAAAALGFAPAACVAVEDSPTGVRAAAAAGMRTVMIPDLLMPTDEIRALCWLVVPDLDALRDRLSVPAARRGRDPQ